MALSSVGRDGITRSLTWSQLEAGSNRLARSFDAFADSLPNRTVAIVLPNSLEFVLAVCAAWKVGACVLPMNPALAEAERRNILELADPALLIGEGPQTNGAARLNFETLRKLIIEGDGRPLAERVASPALASATGGPSGHPKLVVRRGECAFTADGLTSFFSSWGLEVSHRFLITHPLHHASAFLDAAYALFLGMDLTITEAFDGRQVVNVIVERKINTLSLVPAMMREIINLPDLRRPDLSSLRSVCHSGSPCPRDLKLAWIDLLGAATMRESFTSSEMTGFAAIRGDEWLERPGSVGRPIECEVRILGDHDQVLPPGEIGRIFTRPASGEIPFEYVGAPGPEVCDGFVTIGDLGYRDEDGYLYLTGREADAILSDGKEIQPYEVESVLLSHPAVEDAGVVGIPRNDHGEEIHAVVALRPGRFALADGLLSFCGRHLEQHKVPATVEFVERLPLTSTHRMHRDALSARRRVAASSG